MSRRFFAQAPGRNTHDELKVNDPPDNDERRKLERKLERAMLAYWRDDVIPEVLREAEIQKMRQGVRALDDILAGFNDRMNQIILPILEQGAQNGATNASAELENLGIGIDFGLVNRDVLKWARKHGAELVKGITKTTKSQINESIRNWIRSGDPLPELEKKLAISLGRKRAELIASTEVTRVYAEGNQRAWIQSGTIEAKVWRTTRDERVCPICEPLDNKVVELNKQFSHPDEKISQRIGKVDYPPAHPRCRCWISPKIINQPAQLPPKVSQAKQVRQQLEELAELGRLNAVQLQLDQIIGEMVDFELESEEDADAFNELWIKKNKLQEERNELLVGFVEEQREIIRSRKRVTIQRQISPVLGANAKKAAAEGTKELGRLLGFKVPSSALKPQFQKLASGTRAYYEYLGGIRVSDHVSAKTVLHELGHWMDDQIPGQLEKSLEFYDRRTKGDELEWMGEGYHESEKTRKDEFIHPYTGKDYNRKATEVLSMGIEHMWENPLDFARRDPDHFDFTYNSLKGID